MESEGDVTSAVQSLVLEADREWPCKDFLWTRAFRLLGHLAAGLGRDSGDQVRDQFWEPVQRVWGKMMDEVNYAFSSNVVNVALLIVVARAGGGQVWEVQMPS